MQRIQRLSEAVLPPPANLPSSRRRLMQTQQFTERHHPGFDQVRESAADHHVDCNDHSLQRVFADYPDNGTLANRSLIHAKYGFTAQDNAGANMNGKHHVEKHADEDEDGRAIEAAGDCPYYGDHLQQQESAEAARPYQQRGHSENVSVLRAKYGLSSDSFASFSDYHSDHYREHDHHPIEQEVAAADQHGSRTSLATGKESKAYRAAAPNSRPHDTRGERNYTPVDNQSTQQEYKSNRKGSGITSSTLQAAQAQAAELRALHSVMLNSYGFADRNTAAHHNSYHHKQKQLGDDLLHISRPKMASKKSNSMVHSDDNQVIEAQNVLSGASSTSSIADCFIRPANEYPIFMPSHEDMNTMNHRSSVDTCEALMREERLNYIFDHGNKRSFSGIQYSDRSKGGHNVSCLHESLNLPPRSASSNAANMQGKDDHLLHHKSLNLPPGSQNRLFTQNPLFDNFNPASEKKAAHHLLNSLDGSSFSPSAKRIINDGNILHSAAPMEQYASYEFKPAFTGRQRALLEFLSEEPARMRAFNELAATSDIGPHHVEKLQIRQTDRREHNDARPSLGEGNLSNSRRIKGKYESTQNADHHQVNSRDDYLPRHQSMPHPSPIHDAPALRDRVAHPHHSPPNAGVSFDKCRPVVVPLTDSRDDLLPANTAPAAPKEKSDHQKKPFIKGWFFRGKKKHHNVDPSNDGGNSVASISASKDPRKRTTSAASASTTPEKQSNASLITTKGKQSNGNTVSTSHEDATTSSHVFPSLVNSEAEKELEVAMAMDLMELKILQANTKRDAAMAEVLELRLAMDSMAKKLMEVERHCEALRTQLIDVQALQHRTDDQMLVDHPNKAHAAEMISTADLSNAQYSDYPGAAENMAYNAEETDHYESDSIDHREERRPSNGISTIRAGLSSGYGNRNYHSKGVQPTKAEFLNAVADSRVGIRQVSRVLLQHIQESKRGGALVQAEPDHQKAGHSGNIEGEGAGGTAGAAAGALGKKGRDQRENWAPILIMCREAAKADQKAGMSGGMSASGSRGRGVAYCVEAVISMAFHEHFENVGFDKNGAHKILDPSQRSLAFYHSFLRLAKLTPTQLLTQPSPLYSSTFDNFCSRKMRALGRAVGCPGRLWPDELARTFLSAARAVWLLHHLAFAYHDRPPGIFRVAAHSSFDARFMEGLPSDYRDVSSSPQLEVSLMVMPGFFLPGDIIKCKVLAS